MNNTRWPLCGLGVVLASGCAGPMDRTERNHDSWSVSDRLLEYDQRTSEEPTYQPEHPGDAFEGLETIGLDDAVRIAIQNHPQLRSAAYRIDAATGRVTQAGLYPNPTLSVDIEGLGTSGANGGESIYRIEQEIILGRKLRRGEEVAEADLEAARSALKAEHYAVASDISRRYFATVAAEERLARWTELGKLADQLLEAVSSQADAGAATEPDRLRAELVVEQTRVRIEGVRAEASAARRSLESAIGWTGHVSLPLSSSLDELPELGNLDQLIASALESNGRIAQARIAVERARRAHALAKAESMPDLVASVGPRYSDIDNETTVDIGVGIEIPIFDRNQGEIRSRQAERLSAAADLRAVQIELMTEVADAWAAYNSARQAVERYQQIVLPKADRTLELTRLAYQSGKLDYLRLLDAQQVVVESQIASIDAYERLQVAAAMLRELTQSDTPWREADSTEHSGQEMNP